MAFVDNRFEVDNPELKELVEYFSNKRDAFRCAALQSAREGHPMVVVDLMARRRTVNMWGVWPEAWCEIAWRC